MIQSSVTALAVNSVPPSEAPGIERDFVAYLGAKVRKVRKEQHLTQLDLARQVGITNGQISTIERGVSSPSISTLHKISMTLNVPMSEFFEDEPARQTFLTRKGGGRRVAEAGRTYLEQLTQSLNRDGANGFLLELDSEDLKINTKAGTGDEYFLYVLSGTCTLSLEAENQMLGPGDSIYVTAHREQWIRNTGAGPFRAIIVSPTSMVNAEVNIPVLRTGR